MLFDIVVSLYEILHCFAYKSRSKSDSLEWDTMRVKTRRTRFNSDSLVDGNGSDSKITFISVKFQLLSNPALQRMEGKLNDNDAH